LAATSLMVKCRVFRMARNKAPSFVFIGFCAG
jgi:hypothetical protein